MGEHLGGEEFRIVDVSVQRSGARSACFIRHPREHDSYLKEFFEQTGHDYTRSTTLANAFSSQLRRGAELDRCANDEISVNDRTVASFF